MRSHSVYLEPPDVAGTTEEKMIADVKGFIVLKVFQNAGIETALNGNILHYWYVHLRRKTEF